MRNQSNGARAALAAGAALGVLTWASGAVAAGSTEADARIARLEAAVAALQAQLQAQTGAVQENAELKQQVGALQAQVADLKATSIETVKTVKESKPSVIASLKNAKPSLSTPDGRFSVNVRAVVQLDTALYDQASAGPIAIDLRRSGPALGFSSTNVDLAHARQLKDGTDFRRARFGVDGNAFGPFQYRLIFDFGGSGVENAGQLYEGWAQYSGFNPFKLRIGAMAPEAGLADQDSTSAQPLLERPASADIERNFAAGDTRIAAQAFATGKYWLASAAVTGRTVGVVNAGTGAFTPQTYSDPLAFVGRVATTALHGQDWLIHLGGHATYLEHPADVSGPPLSGPLPASRQVVSFSDQAELRVDGTRLINTGNIDARHADNEGAEFAAQWKGLLIQSEYDRFHVERTVAGVSDPHFQGWYVEGSWVVNGGGRKYNADTAAFDAPPVPHPLGGGGFGVVELALRYADMNLNYHAGAPGTAPALDAIRGGELETWSGAVNWYLNPAIRVALEVQHVEIHRLSPDALIYQTPIGAQIGQHYNTFAVRSQLAF